MREEAIRETPVLRLRLDGSIPPELRRFYGRKDFGFAFLRIQSYLGK